MQLCLISSWVKTALREKDFAWEERGWIEWNRNKLKRDRYTVRHVCTISHLSWLPTQKPLARFLSDEAHSGLFSPSTMSRGPIRLLLHFDASHRLSRILAFILENYHVCLRGIVFRREGLLLVIFFSWALLSVKNNDELELIFNCDMVWTLWFLLKHLQVGLTAD